MQTQGGLENLRHALMQTRDVVTGLHKFQEFCQPPPPLPLLQVDDATCSYNPAYLLSSELTYIL